MCTRSRGVFGVSAYSTRNRKKNLKPITPQFKRIKNGTFISLPVKRIRVLIVLFIFYFYPNTLYKEFNSAKKIHITPRKPENIIIYFPPKYIRFNVYRRKFPRCSHENCIEIYDLLWFWRSLNTEKICIKS